MTPWCLLLPVILAAPPAPRRDAGPDIHVDASTCYRIHEVLDAMRGGASNAHVSALLDSVLAMQSYQDMFRHYNRSWRPNHLPPDVFKRMILSLRFAGVYRLGENSRADQMLPHWKRFYDDPGLYERNLRQLTATNVRGLISDGVRYAQGWLPSGWTIPSFRVDIHPNGGSPAFAIDGAQGYDFFQLPRDSSGAILWMDLAGTISHESHHLGIKAPMPGPMSASDSVAFQVLTLFVGEGTATKYINDYPGGRVPVVDPARQDSLFFTREVGKWWQKWTDQEPELFAHLVATFDSAYAGTLSQADLETETGAFWLNGYVSPVYFVGSELFGAIYHAHGKEGAFTAMRDPRELFRLYDDALQQRPDLLGRCVPIPDATVKAAGAIGRRLATPPSPR